MVKVCKMSETIGFQEKGLLVKYKPQMRSVTGTGVWVVGREGGCPPVLPHANYTAD